MRRDVDLLGKELSAKAAHERFPVCAGIAIGEALSRPPPVDVPVENLLTKKQHRGVDHLQISGHLFEESLVLAGKRQASDKVTEETLWITNRRGTTRSILPPPQRGHQDDDSRDGQEQKKKLD